MRPLVRAWIAFWDRREPPTVLALVRILVGVTLLADFLGAASSGLVEAVWAAPPHGLGFGALRAIPIPAAVRWLGATPHTAWILWTTATLALLLFTVGALTRVAGVVFVLVSAQLAAISPDCDRGIDILLRVVIAILVLSGASATWSVDAWVRRRIGRPPPPLVPAWPRYLLFAQLVWMYFSAGISKSDPAWGPFGGFSALAMILSDPHFARWDAGWIAGVYPLLQVATLATVSFEYGAPAFLLASALAARGGRWARPARVLRWTWLLVGASFHLGIAVTMRLGIFPFGMLAVWPVFLHPDELERALRYARPSTWRSTSLR